eukprot:COSAG02_NODE_8031_length_2740_cov_1.046952_1_plen_238_part_00
MSSSVVRTWATALAHLPALLACPKSDARCTTVTLDQPANTFYLIAAQAIQTAIFIAVLVRFKPYVDQHLAEQAFERGEPGWVVKMLLHTGWTHADKAQLVQLMAILVQYAMAIVCVLAADGKEVVPEAVDLLASIIVIVSLLVPLLYILLLSRNRDPLSRWCKPRTRLDDTRLQGLLPGPGILLEPVLEPGPEPELDLSPPPLNVLSRGEETSNLTIERQDVTKVARTIDGVTIRLK